MQRQWQAILGVIGIGAMCLGGSVGRALGAVDLVSPRVAAGRGNGIVGTDYKISSNGQFAVFVSYATDLVSGVADTNYTQDVFRRDLTTGATVLVSVNAAGTASGDNYSFAPAISADGRYVAFGSYASDLVASGVDTNGTLDVFVRDMMTGTTTLVSVNSAGTASGNSYSPYTAPSISADGRYVAFDSYANDLVAGGIDTNSTIDVYVRDTLAGTTTLASINGAASASGNNYSSSPVLSADGSAVAFLSYASDLTAGSDSNSTQDVFLRDLGASTTKLVSINAGGTDSGNNFSYQAAVSDNGQFVAFTSVASDLVSGVFDGPYNYDVFVRDVLAGTTVLASVNSTATASGNNYSYSPVLSADGSTVAFISYSTDLVAGGIDTNGTADVFVRDLTTLTTSLASANSAATASGNSWSDTPVLSADGSTVAFTSGATDLVAGGIDTNGSTDVFVRDLGTGTTTLASINHASTASGSGPSSYAPSLSANGQRVLFFSNAPNLDAFGTTGSGDLFVRDRGTATTTVVNATAAGVGGNGYATASAISADGRYVAFVGSASDESGTSDDNGVTDVFVRDLFTGTTRLVSIDASGTAAGNGASDDPAISADGHLVAFRSSASNLVPGGTDTNGTSDVFVRDLVAGTTTLVSVNSAGGASGNAASQAPEISADGRDVAFSSQASDLVAGIDTNGTSDVFVRDLAMATTKLVSVNSAGTASGNSSSPYYRISISADGRLIAFDSIATDLVGGGIDTNGTVDVFVRDMVAGTTALASVNATATASGNSQSWIPVISADGSAVAFESFASDLTAVTDSNGTWDVFLRQLGPGTTKLVSANSGGSGTGNSSSISAAISGDGGRVAFLSYASDLVAGGIDTNGYSDVFARDVNAGTTQLVSLNSAGTASGNYFTDVNQPPRISSDGQFVAFVSWASDHVAGVTDLNGSPDVFLRDLAAGKTVLASVNTTGTASGAGSSYGPVMSPSGLFVAFSSDAADLVVDDLNLQQDAFRFAGSLCAAAPRSSCTLPVEPQKALLQLKKNIDSSKDKLGWKWLKGDTTPLAAFGDPLTDTSYALCVYDRTAGVPALTLDLSAPPGGTCAGDPCWKTVGGGFAYKDKSLASDGLAKILLKQGLAPGKAKIIVLGKGADLSMPAPVGPGLLAQSSSVTAQLVNSAGACWTAEFSAPATKNSASQFKDKAD